MKKLISIVLIILFVVACSASELEKTKNSKYNYDTTYEELLKEYPYAEKTEWDSTEKKVYVKSLINIDDEKLQMNQKIIFDEKEPKKIIWTVKNQQVVISNSEEINEVLSVINEKKPILACTDDVLKKKLDNLLKDILDEGIDRITDEVRDLL